MSYHEMIRVHSDDAETLERVYRTALQAGEADAFRVAIDANYVAAPDNLLYAAWFYRLKHTAALARDFVVAWSWVIPLALINGLLLWWLSGERFMIRIAAADGAAAFDYMPAVILLAAPLSATFVLIYMTAVGRQNWRLSALVSLGAVAAGTYVLWAYPQAGTRPFQEQYLTLMAMHLPLLAWASVGVVLIAEHRDPTNRFAFLLKSLEIGVMGGLFVITGGLFTAITIGLFEALDVRFPELVQRLFIAGGGGLIPVVAVAVIYDPRVSPAQQAFDQGLSKLVALLMRILLPLTLLVLLVYLAFIPFNFREPFDNRDVLIIYNGMLFAVIALLVGATPVNLGQISPRLARWLRAGLVAVAALALTVSLYALAAMLYRTAIDRLTPNRITFIGWNMVNIGLLLLVLIFQFRAAAGRWLDGLYRAYQVGTVTYAAWTVMVILVLPWLFGIDQGELEALPASVQEIVYEQPAPILLKCAVSPHIYLLEHGEKRWIASIETFEQRGYVWRDVQFVTCGELGQIPDGVPIPADAGLPPQPD
ncbi:MAG: hypothetical protein R3300_04635 [Candidatus Promineifilaceae bacterium]|nr:hypothetical protein [Candidatus Promineifilaceae bacterium]